MSFIGSDTSLVFSPESEICLWTAKLNVLISSPVIKFWVATTHVNSLL
jgi:hypothetical protein